MPICDTRAAPMRSIASIVRVTGITVHTTALRTDRPITGQGTNAALKGLVSKNWAIEKKQAMLVARLTRRKEPILATIRPLTSK